MLIRATKAEAPLTGVIGPLDEDSRLSLVCELEAGRPASQVSWWRLQSITSIPAATTFTGAIPASQKMMTTTMTSNSLANVDYLTTMSADGDETFAGESTRTISENLFVGLHSRPLQADELPPSVAGANHRPHKLKQWTRIKDISLSIGDQIQATLQLSPLGRAYDGAEFLCLANNNQLALPLNSSVTLTMNRKFSP